MNLYYTNLRINSLKSRAKNNSYACWKLGELLYECDMAGYKIEFDEKTGKYLISEGK